MLIKEKYTFEDEHRKYILALSYFTETVSFSFFEI